MKPVKGCDTDIMETCLPEKIMKAKTNKGGFFGRIAHSFFNPGNAFLYHDLGIQHIGLGKAHDPAFFQKPINFSKRWVYIKMMQYG